MSIQKPVLSRAKDAVSDDHNTYAVYVLCGHMSAHSQASAFEHASSSHNAIPTQASIASIWKKGVIWKEKAERGMMEGMDMGAYPCMHKHKFPEPGWA